MQIHLRLAQSVNVGDVIDGALGSSINTTCTSFLQLQLVQNLVKLWMLENKGNSFHIMLAF